MHASSGFIRNAVILGLVTAIGPFAIDMYLPALPSIGTDLGAPTKEVLLSLTSFFISFGLFQLVFGTVSDVVGRKKPLYFGIALFVLAGIGCALATNIETLIALRFLQGIGGAAGIIIARAIVRDMYSGLDEVRMMSLLMLVFSVSPLLAPLAGSYIVEYGNWRMVFWVVTTLGIMGLILTATMIGETLPPQRRIKSDMASLMAAYRTLLSDRRFMGMTLIGTFAITSFFIYLGNSPFVLSHHYGLTPLQYSLAFSINAAAFFATAQLNGYLGKRFGMMATIKPSAICFAIVMTTLAILVACGIDHLLVLCGVLFIGNSFIGILLPTVSVLALEEHGEIAGTAASLMGTLQLVAGAAAIAISGAFADGTPTAMMTGIATASLVALGFTFWTMRKI